jgi:hypothetical protein
MARQWRLWENAQCAQLLAPQASSATLTLTSTYVSVKFAHKIYLECDLTQGNAALVTFTPLQATNASGTNSKLLSNPAAIASILNTASSDEYSFSAGTSFQFDAGLNPKTVIFEILPESCLDVNNLNSFLPGASPFDHIAIQVSASNTANLIACRAKMMLVRDARQNPPTVFI